MLAGALPFTTCTCLLAVHPPLRGPYPTGCNDHTAAAVPAPVAVASVATTMPVAAIATTPTHATATTSSTTAAATATTSKPGEKGWRKRRQVAKKRAGRVHAHLVRGGGVQQRQQVKQLAGALTTRRDEQHAAGIRTGERQVVQRGYHRSRGTHRIVMVPHPRRGALRLRKWTARSCLFF